MLPSSATCCSASSWQPVPDASWPSRPSSRRFSRTRTRVTSSSAPTCTPQRPQWPRPRPRNAPWRNSRARSRVPRSRPPAKPRVDASRQPVPARTQAGAPPKVPPPRLLRRRRGPLRRTPRQRRRTRLLPHLDPRARRRRVTSGRRIPASSAAHYPRPPPKPPWQVSRSLPGLGPAPPSRLRVGPRRDRNPIRTPRPAPGGARVLRSPRLTLQRGDPASADTRHHRALGVQAPSMQPGLPCTKDRGPRPASHFSQGCERLGPAATATASQDPRHCVEDPAQRVADKDRLVGRVFSLTHPRGRPAPVCVSSPGSAPRIRGHANGMGRIGMVSQPAPGAGREGPPPPGHPARPVHGRLVALVGGPPHSRTPRGLRDRVPDGLGHRTQPAQVGFDTVPPSDVPRTHARHPLRDRCHLPRTPTRDSAPGPLARREHDRSRAPPRAPARQAGVGLHRRPHRRQLPARDRPAAEQRHQGLRPLGQRRPHLATLTARPGDPGRSRHRRLQPPDAPSPGVGDPHHRRLRLGVGGRPSPRPAPSAAPRGSGHQATHCRRRTRGRPRQSRERCSPSSFPSSRRAAT
mmetsp:Transcript_11118/g.35303  ORF Transcript_11118/g.35303 Transcript_11118/m.35303 type:complete len:576 (+) Transcript_11118:295-2022(+)